MKQKAKHHDRKTDRKAGGHLENSIPLQAQFVGRWGYKSWMDKKMDDRQNKNSLLSHQYKHSFDGT